MTLRDFLSLFACGVAGAVLHAFVMFALGWIWRRYEEERLDGGEPQCPCEWFEAIRKEQEKERARNGQ